LHVASLKHKDSDAVVPVYESTASRGKSRLARVGTIEVLLNVALAR
jgi:hypothetical protein